jgi:hypothetical protein
VISPRPGAKYRIEESWETQHVVDTLSIGRNSSPGGERGSRIDLRIRIGEGKDDLPYADALGDCAHHLDKVIDRGAFNENGNAADAYEARKQRRFTLNDRQTGTEADIA